MGYFFRDKAHADEAYKDVHKKTFDLHHFNAFKGETRLFWTSIFMRYFIKPQKWFSEALQEISKNSLVKGSIRKKIKKNLGVQKIVEIKEKKKVFLGKVFSRFF